MMLENTIDLLKAAAEPTRFRLLALCAHSELSVKELVTILDQSQPRVSRHLKILSDAGLIVRARSGKSVYYSVPTSGAARRRANQVLSLIAPDDVQIRDDLNTLLTRTPQSAPRQVKERRHFNRAVLDIAATGAIGSLLDIGVGNARIMKLLASKATRLVGIDNDRSARLRARQALEQAGLTDCSVLNGDMYQLPFDHGEFDTVVMDEILYRADEPVFALIEASRTLSERGRLILLEKFPSSSDPLSPKQDEIEEALSGWLTQANLKTISSRAIIDGNDQWLIVVANKTGS